MNLHNHITKRSVRFLRVLCDVAQREEREVGFLCKCSFLEIYKEVITDLLNPAATRLQVREDFKRGIHVQGLLEEEVTSGKHVPSLTAVSCTANEDH